MRLAQLVDASQRVAGAPGRLDKISELASCLSQAGPALAPTVVAYLSGQLPGGRIGVGPALLRQAAQVPAASAPGLEVGEVRARLDELAALRGPGSARRRRDALGALLARASAAEQDFLVRLLLGELRQGALEGVMVEAIAEAAGVEARAVRRAWMVAGDLPRVARAAWSGGGTALEELGLRLFQPLRPMLASPTEGVAEALEELGAAALEWKLDGARVQVHKAGDEVRIYTRRLNPVTEVLPELVEQVRALPAEELILDGEVLAYGADGAPLPFQTTMRRFGRRLDVERLRRELPLRPSFFDCLHRDGAVLLEQPARERFAALAEVVPEAARVPQRLPGSTAEARAFLTEALEAGHEGLMAKALDSSYTAGARGREWLKVKPAHHLDLVVLAAEWGSGRRRGRLSNLHLGARDPESGGFVMLGKTFKGMTDRLLEWQTEALLARERHRDGNVVWVRAELVVEIAVGGVQESPRYPGGVALRFARLVRYRPDKGPEEADTLETVRALRVGGRP